MDIIRIVGILAYLATAGHVLAATVPKKGTFVADTITTTILPNRITLIRSALAVDPDGAVASYTPGNHGYTYVANGTNLLVKGTIVQCYKKANTPGCNNAWAKAEAAAFGTGTAEFCVYAMEVEPFVPGGKIQLCKNGKPIAGNGKGRPVGGQRFPLATGGDGPTYLSTTSLKHTVGGKVMNIDSAVIPGMVTHHEPPLGSIVWVYYPKDKHSTFAVVNDGGPRFGEGTVALHVLLHRGELGKPQALGPIPTADRCSAAEPRGDSAPFNSAPHLRKDVCRPGYTPRGPADIRAYTGIDRPTAESGIQTLLLPGVKFATDGSGRVVQEEITVDRMRQLAEKAGFPEQKLLAMVKGTAS